LLAPDGATRETTATLDDSVLLVALSKGTQPTAGYGFALLSATRRGSVAQLTVDWREPASGAAQGRRPTHPCLVVGLPRAGLTRVEAIDRTGSPIGGLDLP
jgi:hypothetical protein